MQSNSELLFSVSIPGTDHFLGLWRHWDYRPRTAIAPAQGGVEVRLMGLPSGGVHQRTLFRWLEAERALALSDAVKEMAPVASFSFDGFRAECRGLMKSRRG